MVDGLEKVVTDLLDLEESSLPDAKQALKTVQNLRKELKQRLLDGEIISPVSGLYAELKERPGKVGYREILEDLALNDGALRTKIETAIEEYRKEPRHQVKYGYAVQLELFKGNQTGTGK